MTRLYVEWHFQEQKDMLWAGIPSRDGNRMLYSIPLCEVFSAEFDVKEIIPGGRFQHYSDVKQEYCIDLDRHELKERWPHREEMVYNMGKMFEWVHENCREKPWSVEATANMMEDTLSLHFSFADDVAAIAFKFVWQ